MSKLYYKAPTDKVFNEVKEKSIEIWKSYDDTYGYATEKINRIKDLENVRDNVMYMVAMFDISNKNKLASLLGKRAKKAIRERMIDGGAVESLPFLFLEQ